jgi:hypothetical protein
LASAELFKGPNYSWGQAVHGAKLFMGPTPRLRAAANQSFSNRHTIIDIPVHDRSVIGRISSP